MPDNRQIQATSTCLDVNANGSATDKLQDSMWRLKIHMGNQDGIDGHSNHYPDRPGEPDCIYYLRTGLCGYGSNCRYNHPTNTGQVIQSKGELPERVGQPDCQYFLKTGTCKYGVTCKYHHPRDRYDAGQVPLNVVGLPMRQGEKSCPYYMRTGSCKFGIACKFHHPQPAAIGAISPLAPSPYGSTGSSTALPSGLPYVGGLPAWSLSSAPYMSNSRVQGPPTYLPVVLSPSQGMMPRQQSWSTYTSSLNPVSSTDALTLNLVYNSNLPGDPVSGASSSSIQLFPDRPDQPECRYYMKTGTCKYGTTCKYHHPKERNVPLSMDIVGPLGLPMRPGQAICTFYSMYGICKYGSTCKYDHPLAGYYNYGLPALSVPDPASIPYQRNSQITQSSSESSPSRSSVRVTKPETASAKQQSSDKEAPENGTTQVTSPSHTATISSDSPQDQSD